MRITFVIDRFNGADANDIPEISHDHDALWSCLRNLVDLDVQHLRKHPETPNLYDAYRNGQVWYQEEPPGQEDWLDIPSALKERAIDCEDVACWRVAELRVRYNIDAEPWFAWLQGPDGGNLYHIQVKYPVGYMGSTAENPLIEDPCRKLGMK